MLFSQHPGYTEYWKVVTILYSTFKTHNSSNGCHQKMVFILVLFLVLLLVFQNSIYSDTQDRYKNIALYSNLKTLEIIKLNQIVTKNLIYFMERIVLMDSWVRKKSETSCKQIFCIPTCITVKLIFWKTEH